MKKIFTTICVVMLFLSTAQSQPILYTPTLSGAGTGTITSFNAATNTLTSAFRFQNDGLRPYYSKFLLASDGKLYSMTSEGGEYGYGVIYTVDPITRAYTVVKNFNRVDGAFPYGSIIEGSGNVLYGMTTQGGTYGQGVIFSLNMLTLAYTKLFEFDYTNGAFPFGKLLQLSNGMLMGTTIYGGQYGYGTIFSFDPVLRAHNVYKSFDGLDGGYPYSGLIQTSNGILYGTASMGGEGFETGQGAGIIYSFNPNSGEYNILRQFNYTNQFEGTNPYGDLIESSDGRLYGMTYGGGSFGVGTIFSVDPLWSSFSKLMDFDYTNGAYPYGSLIQASDGKFYGTTSGGGASGNGVIFSFSVANSTYEKVKEFNGFDGSASFGNLIEVNRKLFGTALGGRNSFGVVFSYNIDDNTYSLLKEFVSLHGCFPYGKLIQGLDGNFYGMTNSGGGSGYGVIYSFNPQTSTLSVLKDFNFSDGAYPYGSLMRAADGRFYGMTSAGGENSVGVIFRFDPISSTYSKIKDLNRIDGCQPYAALTEASDGKLYGVTFSGGDNDRGVLFSLDISNLSYSKVRSFQLAEGGHPMGDLLRSSNGKLYGTTRYGGINNGGTIFSYDPIGATFTTLRSFAFSEGAEAVAGVVEAHDGKLYGGTTQGAAYGYGSIFSFNPSSSEFSLVKSFQYQEGRSYNSLYEASDGKLYGMTSFGPTQGSVGSVFSFDLSTSVFSTLADFNGINGGNPTFNTFTELKNMVTITTMPLTSLEFCAGDSLQVPFAVDGQLPGNNELIVQLSLPDGSFSSPVEIARVNGSTNDTVYASIPASVPSGDAYRIRVISNAPNVISIDNNQDITVHQLILYYRDQDGDGFGDRGNRISVCSSNPPGGYVVNSEDCNDTDPSIHGPVTYYVDRDGDGYGASVAKKSTRCEQPPGTSAFGGDCDDDDPTIHPGATEICNGIDDDCNGIIDDLPVQTFYQDSDGDGFGNPAITIVATSCDAPPDFVTTGGDCNDANAGIYPGATEVCNGLDDNCDGQIDEGFVDEYYPDNDGDGAGDSKAEAKLYTSCNHPAGYVSNNRDCNDADPTIYSGARELCDNKDNNCDGQIDEGLAAAPFFKDADGDGFGNPAIATSTCGIIPPGYVSNNGDCNDNDATIYPGAPELCDGKDNNCNGQIDEGLIQITYYRDADGDGFGNATLTVVTCSTTSPAGYVRNNTDCNDADATIYPGAPELCDGKDNNCNGTRDEGFSLLTFYRDADGDGYGADNITIQACSQPDGYAVLGGDCNDQNTAVHPDAIERCDGIDNDCNGRIDEQCTNNVVPRMTIDDVQVFENAGTAIITVRLNIPAPKKVTFSYATLNGTAMYPADFTLKYGNLSIARGQTTAVIQVPIINDNINEGSEYFNVQLAYPDNADLVDNLGVVTIKDVVPLTTLSDQQKELMESHANKTSIISNIKVQVLPNPSPNQFRISVHSGNATVPVTMTVIDAIGRIVEKTKQLKLNDEFIFGSALKPGVYYIQIVQGSKRITQKIIKVSN
jgi:uncharacterized repeat protein (TIGR03803 family)